jgi:hypothetical protein
MNSLAVSRRRLPGTFESFTRWGATDFTVGGIAAALAELVRRLYSKELSALLSALSAWRRHHGVENYLAL